MKISHPLGKVARPYFDKFKAIKGYFVKDNRALNFFKSHSQNIDPTDVLLKIGEVRDPECLKAFASEALKKHIVSLNIDDRLSDHSLDLVNDIATLNYNGRTTNFYAFASKYCNLHQPTVYPVYNSLLSKMLPVHFMRTEGIMIENDQLLDYTEFKRVMTTFTKGLDLPIFDYYELDKFLWLYGKDVIRTYIQINGFDKHNDV